MLKTGKKPAQTDRRDLRLANYLDMTKLPELPPSFGHAGLVGTTNWGMMGNDQYGDCVWAGAAHEHMLWTKESKTHADCHFGDTAVLQAYSECTGFDPSDPNSDQGTDMRQAALFRQKTGVIDTHGRRHIIGAFAACTPGQLSDIDYAIYLFGAAGIGIEFPASAMDQFNSGQPWDVVPGAKIEGGHYVVGVQKVSATMYEVVTWGRLQLVTARFLDQYMDEGLAYIASDALAYGKSPEGFDITQLKADLAAVHAA